MKKILILLLLTLLGSGCFYYDYAVDREKKELPYKTYYYKERGQKYDFHTVLYSKSGRLEDSINFTDFTIYITHLKFELSGKYKNNYLSILSFENTNDSDVTIDTSSIKLIHKDSNGKLIEPTDSFSTFENNELLNHKYVRIYDSSKLDDFLTEYVYLIMEINDKKKILEFSFPVEKRYHYSFWDVLMGI